jgi:hypothetical protein
LLSRELGSQYVNSLTNLAIGWPIWPKEPEGWPCSTTIRHVAQIQDEETMGICVVTDNPDSWSSWSTVWPFVRCIDADSDAVAVGSRIAVRDGH